MSISKQEYVLRSLTKIARKKWEFFVISRILHGLDDDEIEFSTQQLVRRPDGTRALTDIYFPQFNVHLEIDEPAHQNQIADDEKREQDIVQITGHEVKRIKIADANEATNDIAYVRDSVDEFIRYIHELKIRAVEENTFTPWNWTNRYSSIPVIERGYVSIKDNVVFRVQVEALRCFGFKGNGWQKGVWKIPDGSDDVVWFPRLYPHGMWHNELAQSGTKIFERAITNDGKISIEIQTREARAYPRRKYIVFAKGKNALGFNLLRYVGTFRVSLDESSDEILVFNLVETKETIRSL